MKEMGPKQRANHGPLSTQRQTVGVVKRGGAIPSVLEVIHQ